MPPARLRACAPDVRAQTALAFSLALGRAPLEEESDDATGYAERHGLENLCRFLLNSNEFLHVD